MLDSICEDCDWNNLISDENGIIDYCTRCDIYVDEMENKKECIYFTNKLENEKQK